MAVTSRQSMAIVMANRIQDELSLIRPHLLCVNTARRSLQRPADRRPNFPGRSSATAPHAQRKRTQSTSGFLSPLVICQPRNPLVVR
jgi:hypothetical protein